MSRWTHGKHNNADRLIPIGISDWLALMNNRPWGTGNDIGRIYKLSDADTGRVGNCSMKGRLHAGDIVMCIAHSGDCFFDYILLEVGENFVKGLPGLEFGSYCFGAEPLAWYPSKRDFHLLCAGESLTVSPSVKHPLTAELANSANEKLSGSARE